MKSPKVRKSASPFGNLGGENNEYFPKRANVELLGLKTFESADILKESASPQVLFKLLGIQKEYTFYKSEKIKM